MTCPIGSQPPWPAIDGALHADSNDMRFATPQGFNAGDQFFTYLKDTFDGLYAEGWMERQK